MIFFLSSKSLNIEPVGTIFSNKSFSLVISFKFANTLHISKSNVDKKFYISEITNN